MKNPRFYTPGKLSTHCTITLDDNVAKHIGKVLRMKPGDSLRLFNGDGYDYSASISEVGKRTITADVSEALKVSAESTLRTHLALSMSRGDRMDYAIQKSVELGVHDITPIYSERCELKLSGERAEKRISHWQQVAISACEQCGRASVPKVHPIESFDAYVTKALQTDLGLVLHHRDTQDLTAVEPSPTSVTLLIGPEGGLSEREIEIAQNNGFRACTLGPRVFRTETAPVASLAILQWLWGDFN